MIEIRNTGTGSGAMPGHKTVKTVQAVEAVQSATSRASYFLEI
jgi:hypothetical protein